ncbi:hypothetical transmembrane protein [Flavobacteria bacterium BBFL7]|nr:hypothetical transmembrane protein [Flavobacteria bacterium BBFL7]
MFKQTDAGLFFYQNRQHLLDILIVSNFMFATYLHIPNYILLPTLLLSIWWLFDFKKSIKSLLGLGVLTLFSCISFYCFRFDLSQLNRIDDFVPVSALFFLSISLAISPFIKGSTIKLFCYFFFFEIILAIILFFSGNKDLQALWFNLKNPISYNFILPLEGINALSDSSIVFGLNSFLLLILSFQFFKENNFFKIFLLAGTIGVVLSGSKYMIFLLLPFYLYQYLIWKKYSMTIVTSIIVSTLLLFGCGLILLTSISYINDLTSQRLKIFYNFYIFINDHLWLGNNSKDYRWISASGKQYHAHNSIIQLLATHGLIYSAVLAVIIFRKINKFNFSSIFFFLLLCLFNHVIFWGFYHVDLIFGFIIFLDIPNNKYNL